MAGRLLQSSSSTASALLTDSTSTTCVSASPLAGTLSLCSSSSRVGLCGCCKPACTSRFPSSLSRPSASPLSLLTTPQDVRLPISTISSVESPPTRPRALKLRAFPSSLRWSQPHQAAPGLRYFRGSSHGLQGPSVRAWGPDRVSPASSPSVPAVNTREGGVVADGEDGAWDDGVVRGQGRKVNEVKGSSGSGGMGLGEDDDEGLDLGLDAGRATEYTVGDYIGDGELERLVRDIATIERQNDTMVRQVSEYTRMLAEASRKLNMCAQSTRIEAAKLKKVARLQQAAEVRRLGEMRLAAAAEARRQEEERRRESIRAAAEWQAERLAEQQRAAEAAASLLESSNSAAAEAVAGRNGALVGGMESMGGAQAAPEAAAAGAAELPPTPAAAAVGTPAPAAPAGVAGAAEPASSDSPALAVDASVRTNKLMDAATTRAPQAQARAETGESDGETRGGSGGQGESESEWETEAVQAEEEEEDPAVVSETTQCSIDHPGALSCLTTTIRKDERNRQAIVTLEATVQCAGDACLTSAPSLGADDYAALAIATIAEAATKMRREQRLQPGGEAGDPAASERRRRIEALLAKGHVVSARPVEPPSRFGHESFLVRLRSPDTKEEIDAMFKPRVEGDAEGWHRAPIEWVAYELNLLLGMDYIPPVAYRTGGVELTLCRSSDHSSSQHHHHHEQQQHEQQEQHTVRYEEGAFIYWVPHTRELRKVAAASWGVSVAHLLSDTRILDVLLNNSDRHHGHFLFGQHWADGTMRPVLIDHAAGFRREAVVLMEHENAFQTGPIRCVSAHTYLRLRFLDRSILALKFSGMLSEQEITDLITRRDQVLRYLDHLVKERGYQRTVVD
ncbi:hypothetical protein CLOM_g12787 [Closterium sp. NIES-68]|nr:hypothetical protein CLOM_g12787 [Closterium sp. NIES-68]